VTISWIKIWESPIIVISLISSFQAWISPFQRLRASAILLDSTTSPQEYYNYRSSPDFLILSERRGGFEFWSEDMDPIFIRGDERKGVGARPKVGEAVFQWGFCFGRNGVERSG
jgi:hypothetical protein